MDIIFRPLTFWPGTPTRKRTRARFRSRYNDTLALLDAELRHLQARSVVIQLALTEADIRLDGVPRANARPSHPGVVLAFESKHGPLSYPCDTYEDWEDNLRAIALSLEHLRAVDRYGVTRRGEQYAGWKQLGKPPAATTGFASKDEAALWLARLVGSGVGPDALIGHRDAFMQAWKAAVFRTHPDRGGDPEQFKRVQAAKEMLWPT